MRAGLAIVAGALALTACGQGSETAAPNGEPVSAVAPATSDATPSAPVGPLSAADLRRVCRAGLAAIHEQAVDAIQIDSLEGEVVNASWRAPVDGGRMRVQCRIESDLITWKPVDRPVAEQNRWMNQSGDPVVRYALDGDRITVTQTLPDGRTLTDETVLATGEEAA